MIVKEIFLKPVEGKEVELEELLVYMAERSKSESGCTKYGVYEDDEGSFVLLEEWESDEALEAHRTTEHMKIFKERSPVLIAEKSSKSLIKIA